jgi:hypothetical protein
VPASKQLHAFRGYSLAGQESRAASGIFPTGNDQVVMNFIASSSSVIVVGGFFSGLPKRSDHTALAPSPLLSPDADGTPALPDRA